MHFPFLLHTYRVTVLYSANEMYLDLRENFLHKYFDCIVKQANAYIRVKCAIFKYQKTWHYFYMSIPTYLSIFLGVMC